MSIDPYDDYLRQEMQRDRFRRRCCHGPRRIRIEVGPTPERIEAHLRRGRHGHAAC